MGIETADFEPAPSLLTCSTALPDIHVSILHDKSEENKETTKEWNEGRNWESKKENIETQVKKEERWLIEIFMFGFRIVDV